MCIMRCENAVYRDSVDELQVNKVILNAIKHFGIKGSQTVDEEMSIKVCCCPANINKDKFEQHFLGQMDFKFKSVEVTDQKNSVLYEKVIMISFSDFKQKQIAETAIQKKIYRQDQIETNIYVLAHVLKDEQIPEAIKVEFRDFDFIML